MPEQPYDPTPEVMADSALQPTVENSSTPVFEAPSGTPEPTDGGTMRPAVRVRGPRRHIILFALTLMTTWYWGFIQYQQFYLDEIQTLTLNPFAEPMLLLAGLPYGLAVVVFLLAHEMGHYLACRYYGIAATLPYFIPIPPIPGVVLLPGTMGAVIRILSPLKSRRALFDVALAGPLAGFAIALPILVVGLAQSRVVDIAELGPSIQMGEPLLWGPLQAIFAPPVGVDQTLLAHPLAFVGWFALLVTAMNLLPIGQLDGGHLLYALTPRFHRPVSLGLVVFMFYAGYTYFSGWMLFAVIVLFVLGIKHPRPLVFEHSLGAGRLALLLLALAIFVSSFILVPVVLDLGF